MNPALVDDCFIMSGIKKIHNSLLPLKITGVFNCQQDKSFIIDQRNFPMLSMHIDIMLLSKIKLWAPVHLVNFIKHSLGHVKTKLFCRKALPEVTGATLIIDTFICFHEPDCNWLNTLNVVSIRAYTFCTGPVEMSIPQLNSEVQSGLRNGSQLFCAPS